MRISEHFANKFFRAEDFDKSGRNMTIETVEIEKVGKDEKMVVHFEGEDKTFPCNRTNALEIAEILGEDDTDDWDGAVVNIYRDTTMFNGRRVACMAVRAARPGSGDTSFPPSESGAASDADAAAPADAANQGGKGKGKGRG